MKKFDCLIIGHNEMEIGDYNEIVRNMGEKSGSYRDFSLSVYEANGRIYSPIDLFNKIINEENFNKNSENLLKYTEISATIQYLGTFLHREGLTYDYINLFQDEKEKLKKILTENEVLSIVIPTTLYVVPFPIMDIISFVKKYNTTAKIIVGGPFINTQRKQYDDDVLNMIFSTIDADFYIINGQGELALSNVIYRLKNGGSFDEVGNIAFRSGSDYVLTTANEEDNKLEENMIDWTLFDKESLGKYVSIRTSISCPFSCSFCGFPQRMGKYRYIDVDVLEKNLDLLKAHGNIEVINFMDDTFNIPKDRFKDILRMMIRNKYNFKWNSMYRCQFGDRETIELMKESGCQGVFLGLESGSDKILKNMNKNASVSDFKKGLGLLNEYDIITYASFIIGFPGETKETVKETFDFIEENKPTFFRTQLWYCDHITPIWNEKEKYKIEGSGFQWSHETMEWEVACDQIDKIFVSAKNSIWLPQYKFEITNLYYLLNNGMSIENIKELLVGFNMLVGNKLKFEGEKVDESIVLEKIRGICKESFGCL
ncbi:PhpK family radical SAM P-methyltransferase [Clostridium estertheticum]|uniref:PhpK family radical SAM P-methyltransferase n=1 Tax=Clostridium estertheticum TaxID=238834 RepID=UPI001CF39B94|nr:PhpK family radical SAM P-methyltransferase [Clostridium estertheticum]MCB2354685.1 PhpK family radical SAM P-methyltransferase [Clostridium estertheticum]WAG40930.1 PhpK family radical SAM P-methyltransferase [Clostridium estertheticum]